MSVSPLLKCLKGIAALTLLVLLILSFSAETLNKAYNKPFWGDEATDIFDTISQNPSDMLMGKIQNQQTGSPFLFIAQHEFLKRVLSRERELKQGWDWHVSFRIIPLLSLLLGMLLFTFCLWKESPFIAVLTPIVLSTYGQTLWYAAETRIYASWLGASLFLYAISIKLFSYPHLKRYFLPWIFAIILNVGIAITAPLLLGPLVVLVCAFLIWKREVSFRFHKNLLIQAILGLCLVFIFFRFWNIRGNNTFSFANFRESGAFYKRHFLAYGLHMHGGISGFLRLIFATGLLIFVPQKLLNSHPRRNFYSIIGLTIFSQILAGLLIYVLQIGVGYFFAERHVIFILAVRALAFTACVSLVAEIIIFKIRRMNWTGYKAAVLYSILAIIVLFDWFNWSVKPLKQNLTAIPEYYTSYCQGPVRIESLASLPPSSTEWRVEVLRETNKKRHSGQCISPVNAAGNKKTTDAKIIVDYDPRWTYE